jgi:acetyltransferase
MGSMQLRNIIAGGFKGPIYPIHPKLDEVQGFKAYKSVLELPETPELAFIILPTRAVSIVMEECGQKGIKRMIITSGGFREVGSDGVKLSETIAEIAKKYDIRFIGPNCLGVYNGWYDPENVKSHFNTMWMYIVPERGPISIAAHSGTVASHIFWYAKDIGAKFGKSLSIGNENNIDMVDVLKYYRDDPETKVIGLYIEEIKRGKEFIELAKEITPIKPIVAIYAGGSAAASRAISSHTGAIAGDDKIYEAVFKETGIISTFSVADFINYLRAFSYGIIPKGNRVAVLTDSGGSGSMMAKAAEIYGLDVPEFSEELKSKLYKLIPPTASATNPIDLTFDVNLYAFYIKIPKLLMNSGEIDGILMYGAFGFEEIIKILKDNNVSMDGFEFDTELMKKMWLKPLQRVIHKTSVPMFYINPMGYSDSWSKTFIDADIPIFDLWDYPVKCMAVLAKYYEYRKKFLNNKD